MTGRVARIHFEQSMENRLVHKPRKSFLHQSSSSSNYSPREQLSSLIEEETNYGHDGSQTEWNYILPSDGHRSSSPTNSIRSGNSSPSEVGDSGVCSEHDTPPPRNRVLHKHHMLSSDSDNESSVSSDSIHDLHQRYIEELQSQTYKQNHIDGKKKKVYRDIIPSKLRLPETLLREICEKSKLMKKRRQQTWRDSGGIEGAIPPTADRNHLNGRNGYNRITLNSRRNSYTNLHSIDSTLSLAASSKFSSTNSIFNSEDMYSDNSNSVYYNFCDSNNQSLFECFEKGAGVGFAGLKDIYSLQQKESTIRSMKGTVRGVKNRVRAGIATFMTDHHDLKLTEQEKGRLIVYMSTLGVVRQTHENCLRIRKILWTQLAAFEERDLFLSRETQIELLDRLGLPYVTVPHVFIEGQYLGDAERIEQLNESGELKRLLQPYKKPPGETLCEKCGGYKYLPCCVCGGSKKSVHRNHFTLEFIALKCSACDESGLVRCDNCPHNN